MRILYFFQTSILAILEMHQTANSHTQKIVYTEVLCNQKWPDTQAEAITNKQHGAKMPQDGAKMLQDGAKMPQDGAKMLQDGAKILQDGAKMLQNGAKMVPRWSQDAPF